MWIELNNKGLTDGLIDWNQWIDSASHQNIFDNKPFGNEIVKRLRLRKQNRNMIQLVQHSGDSDATKCRWMACANLADASGARAAINRTNHVTWAAQNWIRQRRQPSPRRPEQSYRLRFKRNSISRIFKNIQIRKVWVAPERPLIALITWLITGRLRLAFATVAAIYGGGGGGGAGASRSVSIIRRVRLPLSSIQTSKQIQQIKQIK